jgi:hypothetical protein
MPKYYFRNEDDDSCYPKDHWVRIAKQEGLKEIELLEAKPAKENQFFFCKSFGELGEKGFCGKGCEDYSPCNGQSGRCRHMGRLFEAGGNVKIKV